MYIFISQFCFRRLKRGLGLGESKIEIDKTRQNKNSCNNR